MVAHKALSMVMGFKSSSNGIRVYRDAKRLKARDSSNRDTEISKASMDSIQRNSKN